ncbi:hypothetical protein ACPA9J_28015 [Pseudomonas aeruginosa]
MTIHRVQGAGMPWCCCLHPAAGGAGRRLQRRASRFPGMALGQSSSWRGARGRAARATKQANDGRRLGEVCACSPHVAPDPRAFPVWLGIARWWRATASPV